MKQSGHTVCCAANNKPAVTLCHKFISTIIYICRYIKTSNIMLFSHIFHYFIEQLFKQNWDFNSLLLSSSQIPMAAYWKPFYRNSWQIKYQVPQQDISYRTYNKRGDAVKTMCKTPPTYIHVRSRVSVNTM